MQVLIANQNKDIVLQFFPKAVFEEKTKNTSTFKTSAPTFVKAVEKIKAAGHNQYALLYW